VIGTFLLNNYKQALAIRLHLGAKLNRFEMSMGFGAADFLRWHQEEVAFLSTAKRKEPEEIMLKVSYVEALETVFSIE
jgi:hypothetical protein